MMSGLGVGHCGFYDRAILKLNIDQQQDLVSNEALNGKNDREISTRPILSAEYAGLTISGLKDNMWDHFARRVFELDELVARS